jgi:hypothetical protein
MRSQGILPRDESSDSWNKINPRKMVISGGGIDTSSGENSCRPYEWISCRCDAKWPIILEAVGPLKGSKDKRLKGPGIIVTSVRTRTEDCIVPRTAWAFIGQRSRASSERIFASHLLYVKSAAPMRRSSFFNRLYLSQVFEVRLRPPDGNRHPGGCYTCAGRRGRSGARSDCIDTTARG